MDFEEILGVPANPSGIHEGQELAEHLTSSGEGR